MKITHVTTRVLRTPADNPLVVGLPAPTDTREFVTLELTRVRRRGKADDERVVGGHAQHACGRVSDFHGEPPGRIMPQRRA